MNNNVKKPFFHHIEILRSIAKAFDIKNSNKLLDEHAYDCFIDKKSIKNIVNITLNVPGESYDYILFSILKKCIKEMFRNYFDKVSNISLAGVQRTQSATILLEVYFSEFGAKALLSVHTAIGGPNPTALISAEERAVHHVLCWAENNQEGWRKFIDSCHKEKRDRILAWKNGIDLPSSMHINLLKETTNKSDEPENINWKTLCSLLLTARAIDFAKRHPLGKQLLNGIQNRLQGLSPTADITEFAHALQAETAKKFLPVMPIMAFIGDKLKRTSKKDKEDKEKTREAINKARHELRSIDKQATSHYWIDWHDARWHVLSGDMTHAQYLYKQAVEGALYRAGNEQKLLLEEALVVTASLNRPDKVFLKKLKMAMVTFGYDVPSATPPLDQKQKTFSDYVEDWEINLWKGHFKTTFPEHGWFQGTQYEKTTPRIGPLMLQVENVKPDYNNPNRRIKVGETWKKTMPQLIYFSMLGQHDVVKNLLEAGANVDVFSDSNDTPLLVIIKGIASHNGNSQYTNLFDIISKYDHNIETINTRSNKKKLLPILSAIDTGNPSIVNKLLEMGADPNKKGLPVEYSALHYCLHKIATLKPESKRKSLRSLHPSQVDLDSIRRYTNGLHGFSLEHQRQPKGMDLNNPRHKQIYKEVMQYYSGNIRSHISLDHMRTIATLLIENGGNPNLVHAHPLSGYTPLMLAAEIDEGDIFNSMLDNGGNPLQKYYSQQLRKEVNCYEIACYFSSSSILRVYRDRIHLTPPPHAK